LIVRERSVRVVILAGMKARVRRPNFLDAPIAKEAAAIVQSDPVPILQIPRASPEILQLEPPDDLPAALLPFVVLQEPAKGMMSPTAEALGEPVLQITVIPKADEPKVRQPDLEPPGPITALPEGTLPVRRPYFLDAPIAREVVVIPPSPPAPIIPQPTGPQIVQFESAQDLPAAILPFIVQQDPRSMPGDADSPEELVPQIIRFPEADEPVPPRANLGPPMFVEP